MSDLDQQEIPEGSFRRKVARVARRAGREVIEKALILFHTTRNPETPNWVKTTIWGTLAYFILPLDFIPDFLAGIGYSDDLAAIVAALANVGRYVTPEIRERSRRQADRIFGERPPEGAGVVDSGRPER